MTEELEKKMPLVIDKLTKKTKAGEIAWINSTDGYEAPFGDGTIELSYSSDDEYEVSIEELEPEYIMLIFTNRKGVKYDIYVATQGAIPEYNKSLELFKAVVASPKENLPHLVEQFLGEN